MRESLFCGRTFDNRWVEGLLVWIDHNDETALIRKINKDGVGYFDFLVDFETVGQFTEKTDINRLKVFEGHIIKAKHHYIGDANEFLSRKIRHAYGKEVFDCDILEELTYWRNYVVEYSKKKGAYIGRNGSDQHELKTLLNFFHCGEIIGNIHDNPELLEVGK